VGEELVDLWLSTIHAIPMETKISDLKIPDLCGLVVLAKPWETALDVVSGESTVRVDAFMWTTTLIGPEKTPCLSAEFYRYLDFDHGVDGHDQLLLRGIDPQAIMEGKLTSRVTGRAGTRISMSASDGAWSAALTGGMWSPLGRSDWPLDVVLGDDVMADTMPRDNPHLESVIEDRQVLAAFFSLLDSDRIVHKGEEKATRQQQRQQERKGLPEIPPVTIVYLRRAKGDSKSYEPTGRHLNHRFVVRAHPRFQAYGPNRSLRKLIMIPPHIKGPDGAPFVAKEEVKAWTR
jgi:hypothetical protein